MEVEERRKSIAKSWRWRISKAGLNQRKFCYDYNIIGSQLSDWINGKKIPKDASIKKIESILKELGV